MTLRRPALSVLVPVLLAGATLVGLGSPAQADDPPTSIKINEVESNGGTPGDWVELTTPAPRTADVSGLRLKDNDDTHTYAIPAGTTIAAGGYLAVDVDVAGGFGLGGADSARLFMPDGTTLVDSYSWTAHAHHDLRPLPERHRRLRPRPPSTKGAANDCPPAGLQAIRVNEVESNGGAPGDWVELFNAGADPGRPLRAGCSRTTTTRTPSTRSRPAPRSPPARLPSSSKRRSSASASAPPTRSACSPPTRRRS